MRAGKLKRVRASAAGAALVILALFALGPATAAQGSTAAQASAAGSASTVGPAITGGPATSYVPLNAAGSTYAYPALNQWAINLAGPHVNFKPNGSAQGRSEYISNIEDFAGSDIAFVTNGNPDPFAGVDAPEIQFAYSYIPDVAGGLSFMYNLEVAGHKITNMRLSGKTLAEIFTGHITNWDNSAITHDYGKQLPSIPITVATRSDGAGESYFLTRWLDKEYPSLWIPFCTAHGGPKNCGTGPTEFFPGSGSGFKSLNGSDTLSSYVAASSNNGAIGYAEEFYAQNYHLPTVNMLNAAGYYVGPTASNVAIALEKAKIDENANDVTFLMQNLDNVYTDKDPRAYPLSAYSYLIVPRTSRTIGGQTYKPVSEFNTAKGVSLSTYVNYILCGAQATAADLGYSPLPGPMVTGGFKQDAYIPGAVKSSAASNYDSCNNPAFYHGKDTVTATAPYPNACQKVGAPLNCKVVGGKAVNTAGSGSGSGSGGSGSGGSSGSGTGAGKNGAGKATASAAASSGASVDPNTGQVEGAGATGANTDVYAQPVGLAGSPSSQLTFGVLTGLELLAAVAVPAGLGTWLQRRRRRPPGERPPAPGTPPPGPGTPPPGPGSPPAGLTPPARSGDAG